MKRERVEILGYGVDTYSFEEAIDYAQNLSGQIVTLNPEIISEAQKNKKLSDIIETSELVVPDGIGVELGLKILGYNVHRIAGIELGRALLEKFAENGKKIALLGAKPEIIELAVKNIENEIPNINIVYYNDGYFKNDDKIMKELQGASPDLILVALGSPKQDFFINDLKKLLPDSVMIGLGGSFDVWAGVVKRAPEIYQKLGLEWFYRTIKEPKRFKRIFPTLPLFILKVLKERFIK